MNLTRYSIYRQRSGVATIIFTILTLFSVFILVQYSDQDAFMITGVLGTTIFGMGIFTGFYLMFYYKIYEQAMKQFQESPSLISWTISKAEWPQFVRAEKLQRNREYKKYWLMAPVLMVIIAVSLLAEIDDLEFDSTLVYMTLGTFVLCMILLYFNFRNSSLKTTDESEYKISIKNNGVSINEKVEIWGKLMKSSHDSLSDSLWSVLTIASEADRELLNINFTEESGCHYITVEIQQDANNRKTIFIPVASSESSRIKQIIELMGTAYDQYNSSSQKTGTQKYKTAKIAKRSIAGIAALSALFGAYEFGWPVYKAYQAEELFYKGTAMFDRHQYDSATVVYLEALKQEENFPEVYINLGRILITHEKYDSAMSLFNKALELKPDYDLAYFNQGYANYLSEKYSEAVKSFQAYHRLTTGDVDSFVFLADAFAMTDQFDSARVYYFKCYDAGYRSAMLSFKIGEYQRESNEPQKAIDSYFECLQQDSTFTDALNSLAIVMESQGRNDEAQLYLRKKELLEQN
jgi:tetratricopeptide (TPR) repeat protein